MQKSQQQESSSSDCEYSTRDSTDRHARKQQAIYDNQSGKNTARSATYTCEQIGGNTTQSTTHTSQNVEPKTMKQTTFPSDNCSLEELAVIAVALDKNRK